MDLSLQHKIDLNGSGLSRTFNKLYFDNFIVKKLYSFPWTKIVINCQFWKTSFLTRDYFENPEQCTTEAFFANFFNSVNW